MNVKLIVKNIKSHIIFITHLASSCAILLPEIYSWVSDWWDHSSLKNSFLQCPVQFQFSNQTVPWIPCFCSRCSICMLCHIPQARTQSYSWLLGGVGNRHAMLVIGIKGLGLDIPGTWFTPYQCTGEERAQTGEIERPDVNSGLCYLHS